MLLGCICIPAILPLKFKLSDYELITNQLKEKVIKFPFLLIVGMVILEGLFT